MKKILLGVALVLIFMAFYLVSEGQDKDSKASSTDTVETSARTRAGNSADDNINSSDFAAELKPLSDETAESLISHLGKYDLRKRFGQTKGHPVRDRKLEAMQLLRKMGNKAVPAIVARLEELPRLETQLMTQEQSSSVKSELLYFRRQKHELIGMLGELGSGKHADLLLNLANTGAELRDHGSLVMALRHLGENEKANNYMQSVFASNEEYIRGGESILASLLLQAIPSDLQIVRQIIQTKPIDSHLRPSAILLGVRLGAKGEMRQAIEEQLEVSVFKAQKAYILLFALAELVPPYRFQQLTDDSLLVTELSKKASFAPVQLHNQYWWSDDRRREALLSKMLTSKKLENSALAMDYMLRSNRTSLLKQHSIVVEIRTQHGSGKANLKTTPRLVFQPAFLNAVSLAGYKIQIQGDEILIESATGFGWYKWIRR